MIGIETENSSARSLMEWSPLSYCAAALFVAWPEQEIHPALKAARKALARPAAPTGINFSCLSGERSFA